MNVFELTRALVDIESITENEERVGNALFAYLEELAAPHGGRVRGQVERIPVAPHRFNVLATWGEPLITLSTHIDTVPPFFPSREDETHIWGRGSCDTKGIIASMMFAAGELLDEGLSNIALLFVVGEERNSAGAHRSRAAPARIEISNQRRAHRKQVGAGIERRAAAGDGGQRPYGPLRLP
jgi:acetylornithine deacetylase